MNVVPHCTKFLTQKLSQWKWVIFLWHAVHFEYTRTNIKQLYFYRKEEKLEGRGNTYISSPLAKKSAEL